MMQRPVGLPDYTPSRKILLSMAHAFPRDLLRYRNYLKHSNRKAQSTPDLTGLGRCNRESADGAAAMCNLWKHAKSRNESRRRTTFRCLVHDAILLRASRAIPYLIATSRTRPAVHGESSRAVSESNGSDQSLRVGLARDVEERKSIGSAQWLNIQRQLVNKGSEIQLLIQRSKPRRGIEG